MAAFVTRTKFGANNVAEFLNKNGITAMALHGNKSQTARTHARFAGWNLDLSSRELTSPAGQEVRLTTGEFDLLAAFVNNPNQVLSRDRLLDLARNLALQPEGHLRIGCLPSFGLSLIPPAVEAFRAAYPRVALRIQTRHTEELLNALLTRDLDLAVALNPPGRPGIASAELGRTPVVCVGPRDEAAGDAPMTLQALVEGDWIGIGNADPLGEMIGNALDIPPVISGCEVERAPLGDFRFQESHYLFV